MSEYFDRKARESIVQVRREKNFLGSGFFIGPSTVLTCAHVVYGAEPNLKVQWKGKTASARVLRKVPEDPGSGLSYPFPDLSLLSVDQEWEHDSLAPEGVSPAVGSQLTGMGFSADREPGSVLGDNVLLILVGDTGDGLIKVQGDRVASGMSGGPVIDRTTGRLCGMMKASRAYGTTEGGWIVPAMAIRYHLADLLAGNAVVAGEPAGQIPPMHPIGALSEASATSVSSPSQTSLPVRVDRHLPATFSEFTGRQAQLTMLYDYLTSESIPGGSLRAACIEGMAGVGKTALAVLLAKRLSAHKDSPSLYIDLRGYSTGPYEVFPEEALSALLRALDVTDDQIPDSVDERSDLLKYHLSRREAIIVLDNVRSESQIWPLLPGDDRTTVIITSRRSLSDLEGVRTAVLDLFSSEECLSLFKKVLGAERVEYERVSALRLADLCGRLPLALGMVCRKLRERPNLSMHTLTRRLDAASSRVDELRTGTRSLGPIFSLSYRDLGREEQRAFRLLSLYFGPDFSAVTATALLERPEEVALGLLDRLTDEHMIEELPGQRFRFHDLMKVYATELIQRRDDADSSRQRVAAWALAAAIEADKQLSPVARPFAAPLLASGVMLPQIESAAQASQWCALERAALVEIAEYTLDRGLFEISANLFMALISYYRVAKTWRDWISVGETGLRAARTIADTDLESKIANNLAVAYANVKNFQKAREYLVLSLDIRRMLGDVNTVAAALNNLGLLEMQLRNYDDAVDLLEQSRLAWMQKSNLYGAATADANMGEIYRQTGKYSQSIASLRNAVETYALVENSEHDQAVALHDLGAVLRQVGQVGDAKAELERALEIREALNDRLGAARTRSELAIVASLQGNTRLSCEYLTSALPVLEEFDDDSLDEMRERARENGCGNVSG